MSNTRTWAILLLLFGIGVGYFIFATEHEESRFSFRLGLDLAGGTQLIYRADTAGTASADVSEAMEGLREVIERRVNLFGVGEPVVQTERSSKVAGEPEERLLVELPGITNIDEAVAMIGRTPLLEFKLVQQKTAAPSASGTPAVIPGFIDTGLTGAYLERARLDFSGGGGGQVGTPGGAYVAIKFNKEGSELFNAITRDNIGRVLAIFLDGVPISTPVIQSEITGGEAVITGNFTADEAKTLVRDLNFGALPVPIELVSTESVGATLGRAAIDKGILAGGVGFALVALFLIAWYRGRGVIAVVALTLYTAFMLALFKLIPVTITAAGIAGFILSIGMAVDANILIFERIKEELASRANRREATLEGFKRAWTSIRDSNISSIITAITLFWLGTSLVKGFALTFGLGVVVSMFTAITVSRTFLLALESDKH